MMNDVALHSDLLPPCAFTKWYSGRPLKVNYPINKCMYKPKGTFRSLQFTAERVICIIDGRALQPFFPSSFLFIQEDFPRVWLYFFICIHFPPQFRFRFAMQMTTSKRHYLYPTLPPLSPAKVVNLFMVFARVRSVRWKTLRFGNNARACSDQFELQWGEEGGEVGWNKRLSILPLNPPLLKLHWHSTEAPRRHRRRGKLFPSLSRATANRKMHFLTVWNFYWQSERSDDEAKMQTRQFCGSRVLTGYQ